MGTFVVLPSRILTNVHFWSAGGQPPTADEGAKPTSVRLNEGQLIGIAHPKAAVPLPTISRHLADLNKGLRTGLFACDLSD